MKRELDQEMNSLSFEDLPKDIQTSILTSDRQTAIRSLMLSKQYSEQLKTFLCKSEARANELRSYLTETIPRIFIVLFRVINFGTVLSIYTLASDRINTIPTWHLKSIQFRNMKVPVTHQTFQQASLAESFEHFASLRIASNSLANTIRAAFTRMNQNIVVPDKIDTIYTIDDIVNNIYNNPNIFNIKYDMITAYNIRTRRRNCPFNSVDFNNYKLNNLNNLTLLKRLLFQGFIGSYILILIYVYIFNLSPEPLSNLVDVNIKTDDKFAIEFLNPILQNFISAVDILIPKIQKCIENLEIWI